MFMLYMIIIIWCSGLIDHIPAKIFTYIDSSTRNEKIQITHVSSIDTLKNVSSSCINWDFLHVEMKISLN